MNMFPPTFRILELSRINSSRSKWWMALNVKTQSYILSSDGIFSALATTEVKSLIHLLIKFFSKVFNISALASAQVNLSLDFRYLKRSRSYLPLPQPMSMASICFMLFSFLAINVMGSTSVVRRRWYLWAILEKCRWIIKCFSSLDFILAAFLKHSVIGYDLPLHTITLLSFKLLTLEMSDYDYVWTSGCLPFHAYAAYRN